MSNKRTLLTLLIFLSAETIIMMTLVFFDKSTTIAEQFTPRAILLIIISAGIGTGFMRLLFGVDEE